MPSKRDKRKQKAKINTRQLKAGQAQVKKEFYQKLREIAKACGALNALSIIPDLDYKLLFVIRFRPMRIEIAEDCTIHRLLVKNMQKDFNAYLKLLKFRIIEGGDEITFYDYFTTGLTLRHYIRTLEDDAFIGARDLKDAFEPLANINDRNTAHEEMIDTLKMVLGIYITKINTRYYWFERTVKKINIPPQLYECFVIHSREAEKIHVQLNNKYRPAYRIGYILDKTKVTWARIKASDLHINTAFGDLPLAVYIQSHALNRLTERLDCIEATMLHFYLFDSVTITNAIVTPEKNILIEFRLYKVKVGYLKADIFDGKVIIRTFLFITNDGTPEGKALKDMFGLVSADKHYLSIDKLSDLIASDITSNKEIMGIFKKISCEPIFTLVPEIKTDTRSRAKTMARYLGLTE
ncbi:MAG: hypothetical protein HC896_06975 [Bacteroidales bacterium]|nr:hypothetical protein [Bacteroidales bacterium]